MNIILSTLVTAAVLSTFVACDNSPQTFSAQELPADTQTSVAAKVVTYLFEGNAYTVSYTTSNDTITIVDSQNNEEIFDILDIPTLVKVIDQPHDTLIELYRNSKIANKEMNITINSTSLLAKSTGDVAATNGLNVKVFSDKFLLGASTEFNYDHVMRHGHAYVDYVKLQGTFWDNRISSLFAYNPPENAIGAVILWENPMAALPDLGGEALYLKMGPGCPFIITDLKEYGVGTVTIRGREYPKPAWIKNWNNRTSSITFAHTNAL
ncbi:MAG: hypothetical protein OCC49_15025 [Fibrobacterales bacterium]